jgi:hypothetical protein
MDPADGGRLELYNMWSAAIAATSNKLYTLIYLYGKRFISVAGIAYCSTHNHGYVVRVACRVTVEEKFSLKISKQFLGGKYCLLKYQWSECEQ